MHFLKIINLGELPFKKLYYKNVPTTWMNLEDILLGEISQSQGDKYCMSPLI